MTDIVILGAGVSGLILAHELVRGLDKSVGITLVDPGPDPDYNISFWSDRPTPFESVMRGTWQRIQVSYGGRTTVCSLKRYRLQCFWRSDFDALVGARLRSDRRVTFVTGSAGDIRQGSKRVEVLTDGASLEADWVFDSRPLQALPDPPGLDEEESEPLADLVMQGLAMEVEATREIFDPDVVTLFDFLEESSGLDFIYLLPYSPRRALVNVALVTRQDVEVTASACEGIIADYLRVRYGLSEYDVGPRAFGNIPLAERAQARDPESRVVPIGRRGGMLRESTSYAFENILDDSGRIVAAINATGRPYYRSPRPGFYRGMDRVTGMVYRANPGLAQRMMFEVFHPEAGDLALAFLDERATLDEARRLFARMSRATVAELMACLVWTTLRSRFP